MRKQPETVDLIRFPRDDKMHIVGATHTHARCGAEGEPVQTEHGVDARVFTLGGYDVCGKCRRASRG